MSEENTTAVEQAAATGAESVTDSRDWLPEDLRAEASLQSFKDVGGLAKAFIDTKSYAGGAVKVPDTDADESAWGEFYNKPKHLSLIHI